LAQAVEAAGHTVAIIDRKETAFRRLPPEFAGKRIVGVGFDRDRLEEAGIKDAVAVASVTNGDNSNIMIARVAKETYAIDRVVARIYDPRRAAIYERLGIPTVATVQWTIERVLRRILPDAPSVEWIDPSAKVALIERLVPAAWAGHDVAELDVADRAHVIALARLGVAQLRRPDLVIQDGDVVFVAVSGESIGEFDEHMNAGAGSGGH
jgi:trk system potassium uptake protein TrkA